MATYFDKVLYLFPSIQHVSYWSSQYNGDAWEDPYDGLMWENTDIEKPSKETLDALDDAVVTSTLASRAEVARKAARDAKYADDVYMKAKFTDYALSNPASTFPEYLDHLETLG